MSSTVVFGCAPDMTTGAKISSPVSSVTPTVWPPETSIDRTAAPVRMVAPEASALRAIAIEIVPMPPLTWPHSPLTPSISPSSW